jgi:hypothetical protein
MPNSALVVPLVMPVPPMDSASVLNSSSTAEHVVISYGTRRRALVHVSQVLKLVRPTSFSSVSILRFVALGAIGLTN